MTSHLLLYNFSQRLTQVNNIYDKTADTRLELALVLLEAQSY